MHENKCPVAKMFTMQDCNPSPFCALYDQEAKVLPDYCKVRCVLHLVSFSRMWFSLLL